ncbi:hypothetical protein EAE96_007124 [Botrytis aclada]|nr:hypothetical protein EAE96_007124 [Botrytis aclada]
MVAIETRIIQNANVEPETSSEEPHGAQNHVRFVEPLKTSPFKSAEVTLRSKTEEYYDRMVAIESKMWKEANFAKRSGAGIIEEAPSDAQRRVKFQDGVLKSSRNSINTRRNDAKSQLYNRMVKLETRIWIEGGYNEESDTDDKL